MSGIGPLLGVAEEPLAQDVKRLHAHDWVHDRAVLEDNDGTRTSEAYQNCVSRLLACKTCWADLHCCEPVTCFWGADAVTVKSGF